MAKQVEPQRPKPLMPPTPPPPSSKMLAKIAESPKAGWSISDIETACRQLGMDCIPPTRGTHYKVSSPKVGGFLTVPHKRPIKTPYIRSFIGLAEAHIGAFVKGENSDV